MKYYKFIALFIILSGLFLRLWNFQSTFYYAIDEEKGAYIIKGITDLSHFPAVGYPSSVGFRLGPLLYYLVAPFYKIFGPYPYVFGYLSIIGSIISMILIYKMHKFIGKTASVIALALYSFSYLNILYDRRGWPVSFHSLIALTVLYSLLNLHRNKPRYLIPLTISLIAASHFEVATILFIPLAVLGFIILRIKLPSKLLLSAVIIFVLSQSSLLFFDVRHNFLNTKYLLNYFTHKTENRIRPNVPLTGNRTVYLAHNLIPNTFTRTILAYSPANTAIQYANCPQYLKFKQGQIPTAIKLSAVLLFLIFFLHTLRHWQKKSGQTAVQKIILTHLLLLFSATAIYTYSFQGEMAEYYMFSAFAYFFLMIGLLVSYLKVSKLHYLLIFLLFIFIFENSKQVFTSFNPYGWKNKLDAVKFSLSKTGNQPFTLDSFQTCWYSGGYRYLYTLAGKEPLTSYMDQYLSEYYAVDNVRKPDYSVVILTPELIGENPTGYQEYRSRIKSTADFQNSFGAIEVYVKKL